MSARTTMEVPLNRAGESTSPGLSSPPSPHSPPHDLPGHPSIKHSSVARSYVRNVSEDASVEAEPRTSAALKKAPRKKKEHDKGGTTASPSTNNDGAEKKKRAPRGTSEQYKKKMEKKRLLEETEAKAASLRLNPLTKAEVPTLGSRFPQSQAELPSTYPLTQNGNNEAIPTGPSTTQIFETQQRPVSGQNYDPIRSSTVAPRPISPMNSVSTPTKPALHSSAQSSPAVRGMMEEPGSALTYTHQHGPQKRENDLHITSQPEPKRPRLSPPPLVSAQAATSNNVSPSVPESHRIPLSNLNMDIDAEPIAAVSTKSATIPKKPSPSASTGVTSPSHSPKPTRAKEAAPALPAGSGLLSGAIFGGGSPENSENGVTAPTVVINVPLNGSNQYVNFGRLAEEKYGFNALHPRLAAQRDRLARVAAAGAALENAHRNGTISGLSADEMSVDLSNDEGDNSTAEIGVGADGEKPKQSGEDTGEVIQKRRKRIMKEDMYDKDDDFVDDTELAWEEKAAVSKDGFFVYSGPLVPEGEDAKVERYEHLKILS